MYRLINKNYETIQEYDTLKQLKTNYPKALLVPVELEDGIKVYILPCVNLNEKEEQELQQLQNWFSEYFDIQYIQSQWQDNYRPSYDNIMQRQYLSIEELRGQANTNRQRIKDLKKLLQQ